MRTFAWFQALAQVNVSAQSTDPVQITVSASDATPITAVLYAYNDNGAVGYSSASTLAFSNFSKTQLRHCKFLLMEEEKRLLFLRRCLE